MQESSICVTPFGTVFSGPDATLLFQAAALRVSLDLYARTGIIPTRGITATGLLAAASSFTQRVYKRGDHAKAAEDVRVWCETMKAAIPVEYRAS